MFEVTVTRHFVAAHHLCTSQGPIEDPHEHKWRVTATIAGADLDEAGLLIDFHHVQQRLTDVVGPLDGRDLNECAVFEGRSPSAENVAAYIAQSLAGDLPAGTRLVSVEVEEAPACVARVYPKPS